MHYYALIA